MTKYKLVIVMDVSATLVARITLRVPRGVGSNTRDCTSCGIVAVRGRMSISGSGTQTRYRSNAIQSNSC